LGHPGKQRLEKTIGQVLWWPGMEKQVKHYCRTCDTCQRNKVSAKKKYGKLPEKEAEAATPWNRVDLDMVGPLSVHTPDGKTHQLLALTMIDPATGWFEIVEVPAPTAKNCIDAFDDVWLSRYPRPQHIGYDEGGEFKECFDAVRKMYGLQKHVSTTANPQSNSIVERVHQTLEEILRVFELEKQEMDPHEPWRRHLAAVAFAIRSTYHTTLEATPAQLVFGRDMFLPIQFNVDWATIRMKRQAKIHDNMVRENLKRINHEYHIGDKVLLDKPGIRNKLSAPRTGPYPIEQINDNGTIHIRKGAVGQLVNKRRLTPYFETPASTST